jgi:GntR family transcriptional regulator
VKLRTDSRPLYIQAEEALKELLRVSYQPGDRLPPEPQLAQQLGISRSTLREAIRLFEERGLISRRQGVGTFVLASSEDLIIESGLEMLESLDSLAQRKGLNISDRNVRIAEDSADELVAQQLNVPVGTPVVVVVRTKLAEQRPVAHMVDVVPQAIVGVVELRNGFRGSVLDFLLERGRPSLAYAHARLISMWAGAELGGELGVSARSALLLIQETLFSANNEPVGFSRNYFVPGFFGFHVIRRIGS